MYLSHVGRLGIKELRSLWQDKVLLAFVLISFSLMIYTVGHSASMELHNAPIAIVDQDQTPLSTRISNGFFPPFFNPPENIPYREIDPTLDKGLYTFVLVIPPDFERDVRAGRDAEIQVNIDATRMSQAFTGYRYIQNIVTSEINHFLNPSYDGSLPVALVSRIAFNPNLNGVWFGGVMEISNMVTMISIILTGAALIREREHGTIEHLLAMPITATDIMLSKIWANALVVLTAATCSLLLVVQGLLDVPIAGAIWLFMLGTALHLFSTTAIGIFLGTLARSMPQFGLLLFLVILPLQLLSGGVTPRESMPDVLQNIMLAAPTTHFVNICQAVLYRGAGIEVIWPQLISLLIIGTVIFSISHLLFRRSLDSNH